MFISYKTSTKVIIWVDEREWACRKHSKKLTTPDYWEWEETIKDSDGVPDFSGETEYTIVECIDEDVNVRLKELSDYIEQRPFLSSDSPEHFHSVKKSKTGVAIIYNIKWSDTKKDAEEILDIDGKSHDPKQYVSSHFVPDNTAKDKRISDAEWVEIREKRDQLLAETDWMTYSDSPTMSDENKTYRQKLRDLPSDQSSKTKYSDITWPTKP
tara:strand:+ start:954 stop:1589 length:636 start_codon:yes stop_codon:yes gene_type:complete